MDQSTQRAPRQVTTLTQPVQPSPADAAAVREEMLADLCARLDAMEATR